MHFTSSRIKTELIGRVNSGVNGVALGRRTFRLCPCYRRDGLRYQSQHRQVAKRNGPMAARCVSMFSVKIRQVMSLGVDIFASEVAVSAASTLCDSPFRTIASVTLCHDV
eukprot:scaffold267243_cov47-Prasinocladus_malaysianus.AAC.1